MSRALAASGEYQCAPCGAVFGTMELFDAHQRWTADWSALTCTVPAGLVPDRRGTWQTPAGLATRQLHAGQMAAIGAARRRARTQGRPDPQGGVIV